MKIMADNVPKDYKDGVFRKLFSISDYFVDFYNAFHTDNITTAEVTLKTLAPLYPDHLRNDIAYLVGDKLVCLLEHQSTVNPNMPLRFLMYIAQTYDIFIQENGFQRKIYNNSRIKLPNPEFIVCYNGTSPMEDFGVMKLSDSLVDLKQGNSQKCWIDLHVQVLNINYGHSMNLMNKSSSLSGYSTSYNNVHKYF
ncbi:hypothetical protein AGMMS49975_23330 [Clostridia bacterium]|nr:hypothetical protein AGMMS49975_23330 [Clostridia bacterium]